MPHASTHAAMSDLTCGRHGGRAAGKMCEMGMAEFGETVMFLPKGFGIVTRTNQAYNCTPEDVRAWTNKRAGARDRWKIEDLLATSVTMQRPGRGCDGGELHFRLQNPHHIARLEHPPQGGTEA